MIKYITLIATLICFKAISQETIQIDRFDDNKNDWEIKNTDVWKN